MTQLNSQPVGRTGFGILDWIERVGNRMPDPVTLFIIGALAVLFGSHIAVIAGWEAPHPTNEGEFVRPLSLLTSDGMQWVWLHMVENFTGFHPLGVVLVAMLGIGVAERSGLIGALLKVMVLITPQMVLTPAVVFVGIMSSMAADAGYVVLPPLVALVFAKAGRSPLVGLAAVFAGVSAGFSANLLLTALDPLLQGLTQEAAQLWDADYTVAVECNLYFMIASTIIMTLVGWGVTHFIVEKRYNKQQIADQISHAGLDDVGSEHTDEITSSEKRGMLWAAISLLLGSIGAGLLILVPGAPLADGNWSGAIVPLLFVLFLIPGLVYGIAARTLRNDRDLARMMGETMASMGPYIVLAFFAGQFVAWFGESNLGFLIAVEGVGFLQQFELPNWGYVVAIIVLIAVLNLFLGSASAKWALISPVFVPLFMGLGVSPELTQAAYRVGDSCTNSIAPLNPYLIIILVFMQKYMPRAGLGSLISLMLPYTITFLIIWTGVLLLWMGLDIPLGPDNAPLFIEPLVVNGG